MLLFRAPIGRIHAYPQYTGPWSAFAILVCSLALLGTACEHSIGLLNPAVSDSTDTGGGGTVQRAVLSIAVQVAAEDRSLADLLGFSDGFLEGAEVRVERLGSTEGPLTATADPEGHVQFEDLLPGRYAVSALRVLTPQEVAALGPENADVMGFGGGRNVTVEAPSTEAGLDGVAGRRGALVISEVSFMKPPLFEAGDYNLGHYIEVYNNSDTTIYLDGKVILKGIVWVRDFPPPGNSCSDMEKWRLDPEGLWTRWIYAFPGSGRQYPLPPGETALVPTDAINHRDLIHATLLDLSGADFEFMGPSDVDNPQVPNMVTVGDHWDPSLNGHGLYLTTINEILALAEPVDVADLPVDFLPVITPRFWRVPAAKILDVATFSLTPEREAALNSGGENAPCEHMVHPSFDRQFAPLIDSHKRNAIARRLFATLPDGRKILQRTKTSARDFEARAPTPGWIPD